MPPDSCGTLSFWTDYVEVFKSLFYLNNNRFDGVVGYHVSLTPVSSLKVSSSSLGRIILPPKSCRGLRFCCSYEEDSV